jgi:hypothetical protein
MANTTTREPCPFPHCPKSFSGPSTLKKHLRSIRDAGGNEHHLNDDDLWKELESFLRVFTRPGGLSDKQHAERHAQANQRWYDKNKEKIRESQKVERTQKKEAAALAKDLGTELSERVTAIQQLRTALERQSAALESLWVSESDAERAKNPRSDPRKWVMSQSPDGVDYAVFPRFVTFYLPTRQWPEPSAPEHDTLCAQLPNESHHRQINLRLHPDRNSNPEDQEEANFLASTLNQSWDMWKEFVLDPEWKQVPKFRDREEEDSFRAQSNQHQVFADLLAEWTSAYIEGLSAITPTNISLDELEEMNKSAKKAAIIAENVNSPVDNLITRATNVKDPRIKARGGRKRKRDEPSDSPEESEDEIQDGPGGRPPGQPAEVRQSQRLRRK